MIGILKALNKLADIDLLKMGKDLDSFLALCIVDLDQNAELRSILNRVGSRDNDLVVTLLQNRSIVLTEHILLEQLVFDLVKYYLQQQQNMI